MRDHCYQRPTTSGERPLYQSLHLYTFIPLMKDHALFFMVTMSPTKVIFKGPSNGIVQLYIEHISIV